MDDNILNVGRIQYTNVIPFYHGLEEALSDSIQVQYYSHYPTKINLALRKEKIDIALISSLEYLNYQSRYVVLPQLSVSAKDFSSSVLLISKKKISDLDGQTIALSRESLSSAVLLRILLRFKHKFKNKFVLTSLSPEDALEKFDSVLSIGDSALFFQSKEFFLQVRFK